MSDKMVIDAGQCFHDELPPSLMFSRELIEQAHAGTAHRRVRLECRALDGKPDILRISLPSGRDYVYVLGALDPEADAFPASWPD